MDQKYIEQMRREKDLAVKRGWDASKQAWRVIALEALLKTCLTKRTFTVNDFRNEILNSGVTTHDNRSMGGLMAVAKKMGWIKKTGATIPSMVGHMIHMQVWESLIYQEASAREMRGSGQQSFL